MATQYQHIKIDQGGKIIKVAETERDPRTISGVGHTPYHFCDLGTKEIVSDMYHYFPDLEEGDFLIRRTFGAVIICRVRDGRAYMPDGNWHNQPLWWLIEEQLN